MRETRYRFEVVRRVEKVKQSESSCIVPYSSSNTYCNWMCTRCNISLSTNVELEHAQATARVQQSILSTIQCGKSRRTVMPHNQSVHYLWHLLVAILILSHLRNSPFSGATPGLAYTYSTHIDAYHKNFMLQSQVRTNSYSFSMVISIKILQIWLELYQQTMKQQHYRRTHRMV